MGIRKRVRTKWKAERKENIRKVSAQRLKKAQKLAAKSATPKSEAKEKQAA